MVPHALIPRTIREESLLVVVRIETFPISLRCRVSMTSRRDSILHTSNLPREGSTKSCGQHPGRDGGRAETAFSTRIEMATLHGIRPTRRFFGCSACMAVAILLFNIEVKREQTTDSVLEVEVPSLYSKFEGTYQASENDEEIVSHVVNQVEGFARRGDFHVELVDCHLGRWHVTTQHLVLTRGIRSFAEDDSFARDVGTPQKRSVVFVCYNSTGTTGEQLKMLSFQTKSSLPRRIDAADLLIAITRDGESEKTLLGQLQYFPYRFKAIILQVGAFTGDFFSSVTCIKRLFIKISFGFGMSLDYPRLGSPGSRCLSDWMSIDTRRRCPQLLSKLQELRQMTHIRQPYPKDLIYFASNLEPCFNRTLEPVLNSVSSGDPRRIPVFVDNDVMAHAFDSHVSTFISRGHVLNATVLSIMVLLGTSIWLLSDAPSADTFLALLCSVSSSGGCPEKLRNKVTVAASMWLLGNTFFSLLLVDDMTSIITVPSNSRIAEHPDCAWGRISLYSGRSYCNFHPQAWLHLALKTSRPEDGDPIICGSPSEIEALRQLFGHRNLYSIKLRSYGQKYTIEPAGQRSFRCPPGIWAKGCSYVATFADISEWNEYASIVSRFDLLKHPIRERQRFVWSRMIAKIEKQHGCCSDRSKWSKELVSFLSEYEPKRFDSSRQRFVSVLKFFLVGSFIGLVCFKIELTTRYFSRYN